jgi:pyruvate formate lyase activating enzyme
MVVRVPVVPTFNDSAKEIAAIARFADALPNVNELHLLPYHRLGSDKYPGIGREYSLAELVPPTNEHMAILKRAAEGVSHLRVQIGG